MKKSNGKKSARGKIVAFALILLLLSIAVVVLSFVVLKGDSYAQIKDICFIGGCAGGVLAILILFFVAASKRSVRYDEPEVMADAEVTLDGSGTYNGNKVSYHADENAFNFVNMGSYQTMEEKFEQIAKMDKTQFVIFVARLFSQKGYQVKLTPVLDNYNIDMIVQKMDVTIAVGCILTNKILGEMDVRKVYEGKGHYDVNTVIVLTNMYFDRTALDYAKANKISLVDRVILTEDFMS